MQYAIFFSHYSLKTLTALAQACLRIAVLVMAATSSVSRSRSMVARTVDSKCGPGGNDRGKVGISVHAPCTLAVHAGVLFVYIWCIRRGIAWDARAGRNARICCIRACV